MIERHTMTNKEKLEHQQLMTELETLRAENEKLKQTLQKHKELVSKISFMGYIKLAFGTLFRL